ncbi:MAG: hypothetical protein JEZ11_22945 [Desulfobacterales bacterium]|nr:hypothetical protein [Desulfobacterales bacterium]
MNLTIFTITGVGVLAAAVLVYGWIVTVNRNHTGSLIRWVRVGDFLRYGDDMVRVERLSASKALVRSPENRIFYVSVWKLVSQNLGVFIRL